MQQYTSKPMRSLQDQDSTAKMLSAWKLEFQDNQIHTDYLTQTANTQLPSMLLTYPFLTAMLVIAIFEEKNNNNLLQNSWVFYLRLVTIFLMVSGFVIRNWRPSNLKYLFLVIATLHICTVCEKVRNKIIITNNQQLVFLEMLELAIIFFNINIQLEHWRLKVLPFLAIVVETYLRLNYYQLSDKLYYYQTLIMTAISVLTLGLSFFALERVSKVNFLLYYKSQFAIHSEKLVEIQQLKEKLQANQLVLATVSHDLKTPIQIAKIQIQQAQKSYELDYIKECLEIAEKNLLMLDFQVKDIMDFDHYLNSQQIRVQYMNFRLSQLTKDIEDIFSEQAAKKRLKFETYIDPLIREKEIFSDLIRIKQILINLISNAFKFTTQGCVKLEILKSEDPTKIKLQVSDTGDGLSLFKQRQLFQFRSSFDKLQGNGLGLAISQKIAIMLGSKAGISVESQEKEGSVFSFEINVEIKRKVSDIRESFDFKSDKLIYIDPLDIQHVRNSNIPKTISQIHDERFQSFKKYSEQINLPPSVKVLFVDDEIFNHIAFCQHQKHFKNIEIESAYSGEQAVELCLQRHAQGKAYDIAILDYQMTNMNGVQCLQKLKELIIANRLPQFSIYLSSSHMDLRMFENAGFDAIISKPIDQNTLNSILQTNVMKDVE